MEYHTNSGKSRTQECVTNVLSTPSLSPAQKWALCIVSTLVKVDITFLVEPSPAYPLSNTYPDTDSLPTDSQHTHPGLQLLT